MQVGEGPHRVADDVLLRATQEVREVGDHASGLGLDLHGLLGHGPQRSCAMRDVERHGHLMWRTGRNLDLSRAG